MKDYQALRGRVLLVFQDKWPQGQIVPWAVPVSVIATELGVSRQSVYRACPELAAPRLPCAS